MIYPSKKLTNTSSMFHRFLGVSWSIYM